MGCMVETHTFFLHLLIILLSARILAELVARLKAPPVIGELLAGIILGPSLLGWIAPEHSLMLLAEIGVILLLFEVGLDTDVNRLMRTGVQSLTVALAGFALPLLLGFGLAYWIFDLPLLVSLFIGGTLTATSIGITIRVLSDLQRQNTPEGQVVLGAAVVDDVLGVILLAVLYEYSIGSGVSLVATLEVLVFVCAFFVIAPTLAKLMAVVIERFEAISLIPGLIPTMVIALVLLFAWLAHVAGAPELLGGFVAGLALSRQFFLPLGKRRGQYNNEGFAQRVEDRLTPIAQLFTPIFFVMVGLSLNLREIDWSSSFVWVFSAALFLVAVGGKMVGSLLIRTSTRARWAIGLAMTPRGEVGLIFAELGRVNGVFNNEIYAVMVIVIALTTLLPPFALKWHYSQVPLEVSQASS